MRLGLSFCVRSAAMTLIIAIYVCLVAIAAFERYDNTNS